MDTPPSSCPHCGAVHPPELGGLCPRRLLGIGLEPPASWPEEPIHAEDGKPRRVGHYALVERIARGGMGVVYKARHVLLDRMVALKMIAEAELASDAEVQDMLVEARWIARLDHPNIVPLYEVGEHEGRHYFAMKLMKGRSLADEMERFRGLPRTAARLVATVAQAVHYAHQRGVLHRDLKPENLLLDASGVPHVADFGVAKALDKEAGGTQPDSVVGTLGYMAPEQALPRGQSLSVAADVYSLGGILYELLTGRLPFEAARPDAMLALMLEAEPVAPGEIDPGLPRELEAICLKCLEKEPARRYGSAAELADELERFLEGEPVEALPRGWPVRTWMWCRRHPLGAGLLATLLWSLLVVAVGAVSIARAQAAYLRREALGINAYTAKYVAEAVLRKLEQYSGSVGREAASLELMGALQARDRAALEAFCKGRFEYYDSPSGGLKPQRGRSPLDRLFILDTAGVAIARWPPPNPPQEQEFLGRKYEWRDYFIGARSLPKERQHAAYISRAFVSEANKQYTFALAAPVYAADGTTLLGVLAATVTSDSTLGSLEFNDPNGANRTVTLVALKDREREDLRSHDVYSVLGHRWMERGKQVSFDPEAAGQIKRALSEVLRLGPEQLDRSSFESRVLEGYRDPLSRAPGRWLAAVAPVDHTGFAVIVQTGEDAALAVNAQLAHHIAWWSLPFALGVGLVWLVFFRYRFWGRKTK
ncbi:MAG: serine/threonine protein kinase [Myxococcaceae bacterium]|nr:serine/threonine protein kinase [Myxococcaceae bacterium]